MKLRNKISDRLPPPTPVRVDSGEDIDEESLLEGGSEVDQDGEK